MFYPRYRSTGDPSFAFFAKGGVFDFILPVFTYDPLYWRRMQQYFNLTQLFVARIFSRHHQIGQSQNTFHVADVRGIRQRLLNQRVRR